MNVFVLIVSDLNTTKLKFITVLFHLSGKL